jgi:hypothetical protein
MISATSSDAGVHRVVINVADDRHLGDNIEV